MESRCCLPNCPRRNDNFNKNLISFPSASSVEKQKKWIQALNIPEFEKFSEHTIARRKICASHFDPKYVCTRKNKIAVTPNAIPNSSIGMDVGDGDGKMKQQEKDDLDVASAGKAESASDFNNWSTDLEKIMRGCVPGCLLCSKLVKQLTQHVQCFHSTITTKEQPNLDIPEVMETTESDDWIQFLKMGVDPPPPSLSEIDNSHEVLEFGLHDPDDDVKSEPEDDPLFIPEDFNPTLTLPRTRTRSGQPQQQLESKEGFKVNTSRSPVKFNTSHSPAKAKLGSSILRIFKKFQCNTCGKSFGRSHCLKRHVKIHVKKKKIPRKKYGPRHYDSNEKFDCARCGQQLIGIRNLNKHFQTSHLEEVGILVPSIVTPSTTSTTSDNKQLDNENEEILHSSTSPTPPTPIVQPQLQLFLFSCSSCHQSFSSSVHLDQHFRQDHPSVFPLHCHICQTGFSRKYDLEKHITIHEGQTTPVPLKCQYCSRTFVNIARHENHMIIHFPNQLPPLKCDICDKRYYFEINLTKHRRKAHGVSAGADAGVGADAGGGTGSQEIPAPSTGDPPQGQDATRHHGCGICQKKFLNASSLREHLRARHREIIGENYQCRFCQQKFMSGIILSRHVISKHPGEKPFQCKICQAQFDTESSYKPHTMLHTGEKPYVCEECGKSFRMKQSLTNHRLIHTGDKPYQCDKCEKAYNTRKMLNYHNRTTHTNEIPRWLCDICSKHLTTKQSLQKHMVTHGVIMTSEGGQGGREAKGLGEKKKTKNHMCEECGKCFNQPSQLKTHLKKFH